MQLLLLLVRPIPPPRFRLIDGGSLERWPIGGAAIRWLLPSLDPR
jgi:hypothetical protein